MKKYMFALAVAVIPSLEITAQGNGTIVCGKWLDHVDASLTIGTTGVGVDVALPINKTFQVRAGYSWMPRFHVTMNFGVQVGDNVETEEVQKQKFSRLSDILEEFLSGEANIQK